MAKLPPKFDRTVLEIARGIGAVEHPRKRNTGKTVRQVAQSVGVRSEHFEQRFLIERLDEMDAQYPELQLGYAVPNGGMRSKAQAGKLKAEGVKRSVPDYCLPVPRWPFHGLYVEMKKVGGRSSPDQRRYQGRLRGWGYAVVECQGDEAAFRAVMWYLRLGMWPLPVQPGRATDVRDDAMRSLAAGVGLGQAIRVPDVVGPP